MRKIIKKILLQIRISLGIRDLSNDIHGVRDIISQQFIYNELYNNQRYKNDLHLNKFEYKIFSQFGEDGIIDEIFNRIGITNKYFVEIGAEEGRENNTLHCLTNQWKGCWIEGEKKYTEKIKKNFASLIKSKKLTVINKFVTAENINTIFTSAKIPNKFDFLSIDIDGIDYWILEKIDKYEPRVICVEYNALLGAKIEWVMPYTSSHVPDGSIYFGASLVAFNKLLTKRGYALVVCSFAGTNAFFVKKSAIKKKFIGPFTPQNFFQPQRFFIYQQLPYPISDKFLKSIK